MGFSHVGTTVSILSLNALVVGLWFLTYQLGGSVDLQLYVVLAASLAITFGFYKLMRVQIAKNGALYRAMARIGKCTHFERKGVFLFLQKVVDHGRTEEGETEKKVS